VLTRNCLWLDRIDAQSRDGYDRMLRDYIELPLPVRILCFGSLINRADSFVLVFLTIYASEEMGFGIGFATACRDHASVWNDHLCIHPRITTKPERHEYRIGRE
jgi:hypothetical protein